MLHVRPFQILILCFYLSAHAVLAATPQNPLLTDDSLYLSHNGVHRFSRADLSLEWTSLEGVRTFEPVIDDGRLFVGSTQGLYALDLKSGRILWHIEKLQTIFSPEVSDQVYAGSLHGELYAIDAVRGDVNWREQFDGWIYSPIVMRDQGLLWTGGQAHQAYALASKDGRRLHSVPLSQESIFSPQDIGRQQIAFNLFNGDTAIIDSVSAKVDGWLKGTTQPKNLQFDKQFFYRTGRDGWLSVYDRNTYRATWRKSITPHDLSLHPNSSGYLLMSDLDKSLILYDLKNQTEVWQKELSGNWFSPIQIDAEEIIYFISPILQPNQVSAVKIYAR